MDIRAAYYSPLQNAAIWLAAWLYGKEPTDNLIDAWSDLGFSAPADLLSKLRAIELPSGEPGVRLVLSGPGEASGLDDGHSQAIILAERWILVPDWQLSQSTRPFSAPDWLSPGEADQLLSTATDQAADLIEASGYKTDALNNPRLVVGTLSDFYDTPGLPPSTPPRAAKLFARADRVSAIIEAVTDRINDHSVDPQLFSLWRHIRAARMTGVSYCAAEFARDF